MNSLNDVFNIEATDVQPQRTDLIAQNGDVIIPHDTVFEKNVDADYERTRANLHALLIQGQDALASALDVAKQSESPRAFEVVGTLVKNLADINGQLLDLSEKRQKLMTTKESDQGPQKMITNNNAIFVGSTTDLNKMIQNLTKGD